MNAQDIRNAYLDYYKQQKHVVIPRALLVPQNDPTTLFTGSGMQPLIPYLLGEEHPDGKRVVDSQTCLRAQDIDEVGDNRHTTFFEMLGNWSLGDYFKKEQIPWIFGFLTDVVKLDPKKLYVSCFIGDKKYGIPKDTESATIWKELFAAKGIEATDADYGTEEDGANRGMNPGERIFFYDDSKNWWWRGSRIANMPVGEPGGPSTEIFYEFDFVEHDTSYGPKCHINCDCGRYVEIGNNVLMEYVRTDKGFENLPKKNIDFGGGLERIAMAAINSPDAYKISILWPIIEQLQKLSHKSYETDTNAMRVIADHLRGATFLAVDGVIPSNKEQGYVMRRLLRRAMRFAFDLGIEQNLCAEVVPVITDMYHKDFPEVAERRQLVIDVLVKEEKIFRQTLRQGVREFEKIVHLKTAEHHGGSKANPIDGADIFRLYDTFGFPVELVKEEAFKLGATLDPKVDEQFEKLMAEQRARSQTATKGVFKGGLVDQSETTTKYHTANHLMYKALRKVLGDHVIQRGANITPERIRFDFSHGEKVTPEQIKQVEDIVNEQIQKDLKVFYKEYPTDEAFKKGALGAFGDRYGDKVKVYQMGEGDDMFSFEICGGPHVEHTGTLGEGGKKFKIVKEEASSAGVRRVKAVLQ